MRTSSFDSGFPLQVTRSGKQNDSLKGVRVRNFYPEKLRRSRFLMVVCVAQSAQLGLHHSSRIVYC